MRCWVCVYYRIALSMAVLVWCGILYHDGRAQGMLGVAPLAICWTLHRRMDRAQTTLVTVTEPPNYYTHKWMVDGTIYHDYATGGSALLTPPAEMEFACLSCVPVADRSRSKVLSVLAATTYPWRG
jgi:hypothetical protein